MVKLTQEEIISTKRRIIQCKTKTYLQSNVLIEKYNGKVPKQKKKKKKKKKINGTTELEERAVIL